MATLQFVVNYIGTELDSTSCSIPLLPSNNLQLQFNKMVMLNASLYKNTKKNKKVGEIYYTCSQFPSLWICNGLLNLDLGSGKKGTLQLSFSFKPQENSMVVPDKNIKSEIICGSGDFFSKKGYIDVTFEKNDGPRIMKIYFE